MVLAILLFRLFSLFILFTLGNSFQHTLPVLVQRHSQPKSILISSTQLNANLISRFVGVVRSNVNYWIKCWEDPEKMIAQAVNDMESDLVRVRQSYAEILATQRRMEQQRIDANRASIELYSRAENLLKMGKDNEAKELLTKRQIQLDLGDALVKQLQVQAVTIDKLSSSMTELTIRIGEARQQKETYAARAKTAKTSLKINNMLSSVFSSSSMGTFNRMKEKVESLEIEADIAREMSQLSDGSSSTSSGGGADSALGFQTARQEKVDSELKRLYDEIDRKSHRASSNRRLLPSTVESNSRSSGSIFDVEYTDVYNNNGSRE